MENTKEISERLLQFTKQHKIKDRALARRLGIGYPQISKWRANTANISPRLILIVLNEYTNLNANWLLRGQGNMLQSEEGIKTDSTIEKKVILEALSTRDKQVDQLINMLQNTLKK